ncbi:MAG TPA: lipid A export permease/ATP-binding protein MsbA [Xanthomonadaceae bacterium]|nr:lipid A export permease/ATP-binding protein MsbA [Xanthomonadaceae bacterium]
MSAARPFWPIYRRLLRHAVPHWPVAVLAVLGMVLEAAAAAAFTYMLKPMLDGLFVARDAGLIFWMPILIVALFSVRGLASFMADYGVAYIGRNIVAELRGRVFERYLDLPAAYFDREPSGQLIGRVTFNVEQVAGAATEGFKTLVIESLTIVGMVTVMLWHSWQLTLLLGLMAPLIALVVTVVARRYRRLHGGIQQSVGEVAGIVEEAVAGNREVKIYGAQAQERARFSSVTVRNRLFNIKVAATAAASSALIQIVAALALAAVIYFATRPTMLEGMSSGTFISLISAMLFTLPSLKRLSTVQTTLQKGVTAAGSLYEVIDAPGEADTGVREIERARGQLEFRGVELRYDSAEAAALRGVGFLCAPGSITALVGRSGSGKTSLVGLVPRFYEPTAGTVLLDGIPIREFTLASLREQIAFVGQQVVLFDGSVAANIAYGALAGASRAAVTEAARAANALEFIERLPQGFDTRIGEGGALLSGGQRQRLAIARALLKNAPILILDEATSALDSESEKLVQEALARIMAGRTTLVIAHRLSTIEHADRVIVLDEGRVAEQGSHAELLARQGLYWRLHQLQFSGGDVHVRGQA